MIELAARPDAIECLEAYAAAQGRSGGFYSMNAKYVQRYLEDALQIQKRFNPNRQVPEAVVPQTRFKERNVRCPAEKPAAPWK
ncbi:hypothetical protein [Pseudoflavonifractor sp. 524-17]|uniref:hypothetical protein n=1 Tax=Pseudoflavonifractor sp. 524-17 TaxID=2304577 RepID=UPI00137A23CC|nr:hypothetical protein [Pseudoflavonifractor sp. 524-17]